MSKWQVFRINSGALAGMWVAMQPGVMTAHFITWTGAYEFATRMARAQRQAEAMSMLWID